jgi:hypothetical protein
VPRVLRLLEEWTKVLLVGAEKTMSFGIVASRFPLGFGGTSQLSIFGTAVNPLRMTWKTPTFFDVEKSCNALLGIE